MELIDWYDATLDAKGWWNLARVTPNEAAMLLCEINPHDFDANPLHVSSGQTTPNDYVRLKRVFEDAQAGGTHHYTLKKWHEIAKNNNLKYHSWIDEYSKELELISQGSSKVIADKVKGLNKRKIMSAFDGHHFDYSHWGKNLASPPNWLIECRVQIGTKSVSALWCPVLIAIALLDKGVTLKELDLVFMGLKDWRREWQDKSEYLR